MKNNVSFNSSTIDKVFIDKKRFLKESAMLKFLSTSRSLSGLVPLFIEESCETKNFSLRMSRLNGLELSLDLLTDSIVFSLGTIMAKIHSIGKYNYCGTFNSSMEIENGRMNFNDFILAQISKWSGKLLAITAIHEKKARRIFNFLTEHQNLFPEDESCFCHNDFDLKNVIVNGGNISGVIDWEFAGAYPLFWEIRKIIPHIFWNDDYRQLFINGYKEIKPLASFPNTAQQSLVVATDCIGALSWAYQNNDKFRIKYLEEILEQSLETLG